MNYSPDITLGNIIMVVTLIVAVAGAYHGLKGQIAVIVASIAADRERLNRLEQRHEQRMSKLEDNDQRLTQIVQQLMGQQVERDRWDGPERRKQMRRQI